jgi:hypothetical protein
MIVLYAALIGLGLVCCVAAVVWSIRTRHERRLWRTTHDTSTLAIVLELEDRVHELEERVHQLDRRSTPV